MQMPDIDDVKRYEKAWALFERGDHIASFREYRALAESGSPSAQDFVGWMYLGGVGTTVDVDAARSWYQRAADAGYAWAQYHLGCLAFWERDYDRAVDWFERAASQGHLPAIYRLAVMYRYGQGRPVDRTRGWMYLADAAEKGHLRARADMAREMARTEPRFWQRMIWRIRFVKALWDGCRIAWKNPNDKRLGRH
jgi:TPR repeat protein